MLLPPRSQNWRTVDDKVILPTVGRGNARQPTASEEAAFSPITDDLLFCPIVGAMLAGSLSGVRLKVLLTFSVGPKRKGLREELAGCLAAGSGPRRHVPRKVVFPALSRPMIRTEYCVAWRSAGGCFNHERERGRLTSCFCMRWLTKPVTSRYIARSSLWLLPCRDALTSCSWTRRRA
jgi:hypothetical protein